MSDSEDNSCAGDKLELILNEISKFQTYTKKKLAEISTQNKCTADSLLEIKKELEGVKKENAAQKLTIQEQQSRITYLERKEVDKTVCFNSIPKKKDENLNDIVWAIAKAAGVHLTTSSIVDKYRRKDKADGSPGDLVIKCVTKEISNAFLYKVKDKKVSLKDIGFASEDRRCYCNADLTLQDKKLLLEAKRIRKTKNWAYVWYKNGKVLVRKVEGGEVIHITSIEKLNRL